MLGFHCATSSNNLTYIKLTHSVIIAFNFSIKIQKILILMLSNTSSQKQCSNGRKTTQPLENPPKWDYTCPKVEAAIGSCIPSHPLQPWQQLPDTLHRVLGLPCLGWSGLDTFLIRGPSAKPCSSTEKAWDVGRKAGFEWKPSQNVLGISCWNRLEVWFDMVWHYPLTFSNTAAGKTLPGSFQ